MARGRSLAAVAFVLAPAGCYGPCLPLTNMGGIYTTVATLGTPPQSLNLVADTGSYNLLVDSTLCSQPECAVHNSFDPNVSSTYLAGEKVVVTGYGQGQVRSLISSDTVRLGQRSPSDTTPALSAAAVPTLLMKGERLKNWDRASYDGIMGLGKRNQTDANTTALLTSLGVDRFTACLGGQGVQGQATRDALSLREAPGGRGMLPPIGDGIGGRLMLTDDMPELAGQFKPLETVGRIAWALELSGWSLQGERVADPACSAENGHFCAALVDTGTTLITLPKASYQSVMNSIDHRCQAKAALNTSCLIALQSQQNCSGAIFDALPDIGFTLGGQELAIPPSAYMASLLVELPAYEKLGPFIFETYKEGVRCVPALSAFPDSGPRSGPKVRWTSKDGAERMGPMVIFGQPFFRKYATHFDRISNGISVASVPEGSQLCDTCPASAYTDEQRRRRQRKDRSDSRSSLALTAADELAQVSPPRAAVAPLALSEVRVPWYAIHPDQRRSGTVGASSLLAGAEKEWHFAL